jgi:branched-chain amino acid transport system permease protein
VNLRRTIRGGAMGGTVLVYLCLVGMVGTFSDLSLIGTWLTAAGLLLVLPPVVAGAVMTRPRVQAGERRTMALSTAGTGAATGFASGAVLAVGMGLVQVIGIDTVRRVFVSVSPILMETLTFGLSTWGGALVIVIGAAALGGAGALLRSMPRQIRRPIVVGTVAVVALGLLQRVVPSIFDTLSIERDWLYRDITNGLQTTGALIVFLLSVGVTEGLRRLQGRSAKEAGPADALPPEEGAAPEGRRGVPWGGVVRVVVLAVALVALPQLAGPVVSESLGTVGIYVLLGLGLNIVVGYAGLLDLGYVAFVAVGAYFFALLTGSHLITAFGLEDPLASLHVDPFVAIALVAGIAALIGLVIGAPVLRLRGDYLAIVTLGFGEIARVLLTSDWLQPVFGGARGLGDITDASIGSYGFRQPQHFYYLVLALCLFAVFVSWRLQDSRIGRAWTAMREDEQVADATGVSTVRYKLLAFAMGGAIGSLGGAVYAIKLGSLSASGGTFGVLVSVTVLAVVILGGLGSIRGVIVGALVLIGLPDLLSQFEEYRLLVYGAALMVMMLQRPQGLVPNSRRTRELLEVDRSQDRWTGALAADKRVASEVSPVGEGSG